jgi:hypothetical protein
MTDLVGEEGEGTQGVLHLYDVNGLWHLPVTVLQCDSLPDQLPDPSWVLDYYYFLSIIAAPLVLRVLADGEGLRSLFAQMPN